MPAIASPAANVTACCSQMPTSKKRSGNSLAKFSNPVDDAIAAVIAQTSGRRTAELISASQQARDVVLDALVARIHPQLRQMASQTADGRRVRAAVVVDDDDQVWRHEVRDLVQGLVCHAAGERPVADHCDDKTADAFAEPRL